MDGNLFHWLMREIFQELLSSQQLMEDLQEENRQLRRQLTALREARGIAVDICGRRFALVAQARPAPTQGLAAVVPTFSSTPDLLGSVPAVVAAQQLPASHEPGAKLAEIPTAPLLAISLPGSQAVEEEEASIGPFVEELMRDEFLAASIASARPTAIWSQQSTQDDEGAALRRQLIGSFLLE